MTSEKYYKICPSCGKTQQYKNIASYKQAIKGDWGCNECSNTHKKKIYDDKIVKEVINRYVMGESYSKISKILKIRRGSVKEILTQNKIFVDGRDDIKKIISDEDVKKIIDFYKNGVSCIGIGRLYNMSYGPIKKILQQENIFKKGNSPGIKFFLSNEQKEEIKHLYLNENKSTSEISKILNFTDSFLQKHIKMEGYMRNRSEAISLRQTGKKRSPEVCEKMKLLQIKLAKSGNRKQTGGTCKKFIINDIECTGTYEKFYIESLIEEKKELPINSKPINTPYGVYYPDFFKDNTFIEIKSDYTYDVLIGKKINRWSNKIDTTQLKKIKWVSKNVLPVDILVVDKRNNKIIKK